MRRRRTSFHKPSFLKNFLKLNKSLLLLRRQMAKVTVGISVISNSRSRGGDARGGSASHFKVGCHDMMRAGERDRTKQKKRRIWCVSAFSSSGRIGVREGGFKLEGNGERAERREKMLPACMKCDGSAGVADNDDREIKLDWI
jgi:hypothetical protein